MSKGKHKGREEREGVGQWGELMMLKMRKDKCK